ncbi:Syntaxin-7 [Porphyridium purpureum]|uniref:Syntaxin-7 n=1 Tax=Porphyridium purpureum TaxID=35688 RepID=A0A5J4YGA5_PORPP|nr:Syntaxin-7 [Porphyridium purpureum]|eukprot:POR5346..scf237_24
MSQALELRELVRGIEETNEQLARAIQQEPAAQHAAFVRDALRRNEAAATRGAQLLRESKASKASRSGVSESQLERKLKADLAAVLDDFFSLVKQCEPILLANQVALEQEEEHRQRGSNDAASQASLTTRAPQAKTPLLLAQQQQQQQQSQGTKYAALEREAQTNFEVIEERDAEMRHIQNSLLDIREVMQELHVLTQEQGKQVDQVALDIESAGEYVTKGERHLEQAHAKRQRRRKCFCCTLVIVVLVISIYLLLMLL